MKSKNIKAYIEKMEKMMVLVHHSMKDLGRMGLHKIDITPGQCMVLKMLSMLKNCTMTDLSKHFGVTMGNMTGIIDRLIIERYVKRIADPSDRRLVRIKLSPKGRRLITKIDKHRKAHFKKMLEKMSKQDVNTMLGIMERLVFALKKG